MFDLLAELSLGVNIEIKPCAGRERETAATIAALVKSEGRDVPVLLSSFSRESLSVAREIAPAVPRGLLIEGFPDDWQKAAESLDVTTIHADQASLTPERVAMLNTAGYRVLAWTVNDTTRARALAEMGVTAVITDHPARIKAALEGDQA